MIFKSLNCYFGLGLATLLIVAGSIAQVSAQSTSSGGHSVLATSHIHLGSQDARVASSRYDDDEKDDDGNDDRDDDDQRQSPKNS